MISDDVLKLYNDCKTNNITIWIDGGWCVDALLGEQTREHPDLDIAVERKDAVLLKRLLEAWGYDDEPRSDTTAWNFVMKDTHNKTVDVHVFAFGEGAKNIYGIAYPYDSLTGIGTIDGQKVNCISPEWMFKFKIAYPPKEKDLRDFQALSNKFGFELPRSHSPG